MKKRLFQTVGAQHENRRAAMFVNEDCVVTIPATGREVCDLEWKFHVNSHRHSIKDPNSKI